MERVLCKLRVGLLVLMSIGTVHSNDCHTRQGNCCISCNPGFYLLNRDCGSCSKCPPTSYMDQASSMTNCNRCKRCEGIFQYKEYCTSTKNAVCECIKGKKCFGPNCEKCANNTCPEGQEHVGEKCMDCRHGMFKPGTDGACKPWTSCSAEGSEILVNGTSTSNVVCVNIATSTSQITTTMSSTVTAITTLGHPEKNPDGMATMYIIVGAAVLVGLLVVIGLVNLRKCVKKMKNEFKKIPIQIVRTTEEEDACSCHFPEEEQGDEALD
ncbi:tumor necrosis factor receptor superfamily member 9 isoform X1 [Ascaphus truei]|uniref:tumor necrosis factor receptor superfamily member 9 isoform X1 n=2 Tax=Ascaphus truei TaxID=8439 RepID=UPI003F5970AA